MGKLHQAVALRTLHPPVVIYDYCESCGALRKWGELLDRNGVPAYWYKPGVWQRGAVKAPYCLAKLEPAPLT